MDISLRVLLMVFGIFWLLIILFLLYKGKLPIKYSLFWLFSALLIFLVGLVPDFIWLFAALVGFETISNLVIGIMIGILLLITLLLTIIVSNQKRKINLLIQEISIIKKSLEDKK